MAVKTEADRVEEALVDLVKSQAQLAAALRRAGRLAGIDCKLLDRSRDAAAKVIEEIRLGEIKISRWAPPAEDDASDLIGDDFG